MPTIQFEALDTLFFRDGKPFTMGEDNFAEGAFPPSPSVIYGALRTAYIAQNLGKNGKNLDNLITDTEGLVIMDIAYLFEDGSGEHPLRYPMPLDYAELKSNEERKEAIGLKYIENNSTSSPMNYLHYAESHVEQSTDAVFSRSQFENYLEGNTSLQPIKKWLNLIISEPKFGNSRNNETRSTSDDDGNVYRVLMRRLKNEKGTLKIAVSYVFDKSIDFSLIRLGGEGKAVDMKPYRASLDIDNPTFSDKYFKIVFLTTAVLNGIAPDLSFLNGIELQLLAKSVGKPLRIGGWDMAANNGSGAPKSMLSAIPSGSVFCYKILNGKSVDDVVTAFKDIVSLSDERKKEGFGLFKIANLKFNENLIAL